MFDIHVFGSSSKGNCMYVDTGNYKFLLDVGLSGTKTKKALYDIDVKLTDIDFVLITHEHGDHIKGLDKLSRECNFSIISSKGTLSKSNIITNDVITMKNNSSIKFGDLTITSKTVLHDAIEPLCFSIENEIGEKLLYLTDCGNAKPIRFKNHDVYIIEANYSNEILEKNFSNGTLHRVRRDRALSGMGHLEINQTIEFLRKNMGDKTKQVILSHLSSDNSNKDVFKNLVIDELFFFDVDIAKEGLHINCGDNPHPF